tara:strand:- start:2929 stop:4359 length:1431 start_codon:yes stop_codon:yes gene_type:complete
MSIEDVEYLKSHSEKESYIFYVDSSDRNRSVWNTPSEYNVIFDAPFKHVYSMQVLDASIPRTQYGIDNHNNSITFAVNGDPYETKSIEVGDYTDINIISTLNGLFDGDIEVFNSTIPADEKSTFVFKSIYPFQFDMSLSTCKTALGFDMYANDLDVSKGKYDRVEVSANTGKYFDQQFKSLLSSEYKTYTSHESPLPLGDFIQIDSSSSTKYVEQEFINQNYGYLTKITIAIINSTSDNVKWTLYDENYASIQDGTATINNGEVYATTIISPTVPTAVQLTGESIYKIRIYVDSGSADIAVNPSENGNIIIENSNSQNGGLCFGVEVSLPLHKITAPGMYSLIGDRYVLLKCHEIDQHMFRSRAFEKYNLGLAKFKLAVIGYDETRLDFSTVPAREFHPIGKLTQLTFRFERPDGSLYNFRGINHTITLVLHYYSPKQREIFDKSVLAPHYDPDIFRYQQRDSESDIGSDSSDSEN